jgi:hypothetical protein
MKKTKTVSTSLLYGHNPKIFVYYELEFGKHTIVPGDKIKIKNERGYFTFVKWVHNTDKNVVWVTCLQGETRQFRHFYLDQLKGPVIEKKKRVPKNVG